MLLQKIKDDLKHAMKAKNEAAKDAIRMVLGEVPRLNKKRGEKPTDKEIENIITKLIKSETTVAELIDKDISQSVYIQTLKKYLPQKMDKSAIKKFILDNIDINSYNPKIKAMKDIMKVIGKNADGKLVREVLMGL